MNTLFVSSSAEYNGALRIQGSGDNYEIIKEDHLDQLGMFRNWPKIQQFKADIENKDTYLYFDVQANVLYHNYLRFTSQRYEVDSPFFKDHQLYPFQSVGLNYIYHIITRDKFPRFLLQTPTGSGKSLMAALTTQKLFNEGRIDMVLCFCKKIKTVDWQHEFERDTTLESEIIDGTREYRHKRYLESTAPILIMNYEKARFPSKSGRGRYAKYDWSRTDLEQLLTLTKNKRILIICDEAHRINNSASYLTQGFNALVNNKLENHPTWSGVLALTATPYTSSPMNIRDLFTVIVPKLPGVAMPIREFKDTYMDHTAGYDMFGEVRRWDQAALYDLGKKHERYTYIVSKNDPEIAAQFPPQTEEVIDIELSPEDKLIYNAAQKVIKDKSSYDYTTLKGSVMLMRALCNTTESIYGSDSDIARMLAKKYPDLTTESSYKFQFISDMIQDFLNLDQKVMLFTFWTGMGLFPYKRALEQILGTSANVLSIHGGSMTSQEMIQTKDKFNAISGGAVLLSSDIGNEGINVYCENLIHIETPLTYASYDQRNGRISRSDSFSQGVNSNFVYRFITKGTIEERIEKKVLTRRDESNIISGDTLESLREFLEI